MTINFDEFKEQVSKFEFAVSTLSTRKTAWTEYLEGQQYFTTTTAHLDDDAYGKLYNQALCELGIN